MIASLRLIGFIAWRFSRGAKQQRFASFVSWFSTLGITLGVASLITVIAVMSGFESQLKLRILNLVPHLSLPTETAEPEAISGLPKSPLILSEVVLQSQSGLQAAVVQGIDVEQQVDAGDIAQHLLAGDLRSLESGSYQVVLGLGLANALGVNVGDRVRLMATDKVVYTPLGELPSQRNFTVGAIFEYAADVDKQFALTNIDDLARLLRTPRAQLQQTRYFLEDPFQIEQLGVALQAQGVEFSDWRAYYGEFFQAVRMERNMMSLLFCLIVAVAAFNILSSLVMMVGEKQGDVAILQTLGLNSQQVVAVFMTQGAWSGCIGALVGAVCGYLLSLNINPVLSAFGLNYVAGVGGAGLPVQINLPEVAGITFAAMALSIVATIYPAWRASNVLPAEALRHE